MLLAESTRFAMQVASEPAGAETASDKTAIASCTDTDVAAQVRRSQLDQQTKSDPLTGPKHSC